LIGHGYWIVVENVAGQESTCDSTCGAIIIAELPEWTRCVDGAVFKTFNSISKEWIMPTNPSFYTAITDDNILTTTTTTTTTTLGVNDYVQLSGINIHSKYNGLYIKSGTLNDAAYYYKNYRQKRRTDPETHFLFLTESGNSWIVSSELNTVSGDLYLSVVGGGSLESSQSWFLNIGGEWQQTTVSAEVANNLLPIDECETLDNPCLDPLTFCTDRLDGFSCECIPGYVEDGDGCVDLKECQFENICEHGYVCNEMVGSYECVCPVSQSVPDSCHYCIY
jgi:hypothetical protein